MNYLNTAISVIIPSLGSQTLSACIESLANQSLSKNEYEVIVVLDNQDCDLELSTYSGLQIRVLNSNGKGPAAARNTGIKAANGEYIFFTDDDCKLDSACLEQAIKAFSNNPDASIVEGKTEIDISISNFFTAGIFMPKEKYNFPTCNLAVRKNALIETGMFDEKFKAPFREDSDLIFRLVDKGFKYVHNEKMVVHHPTKIITFFDNLRRSRYWIYEPLLFCKHPDKAFRHSSASRIGFLPIVNKRLHVLFLALVVSYLFNVLGYFFILYFLDKADKTYTIYKQLKAYNKPDLFNYFLFFIFSDLFLVFRQYFLIRGSLKFKRLVL